MHSLGTLRPQALNATEDEAWNAIMRISSGSTAEKELPVFLATYDDMRRGWEQDGNSDLDLSFFASGKTCHLAFSSSYLRST